MNQQHKSVYKSPCSTRQRRYLRIALTPLAAFIFSVLPAHAEVWFDPSMISGNAQDVADLSRFEQAQQPAGEYKVSILVNNVNVANRNVNFKARKPADGDNQAQQDIRDDTGLIACLSAKDLASMGIILPTSPALTAATAAGECISPGRFIPGAWSTFNFPKMQLEINVPQAAMQNHARGWIAPERWDEGINALMFNYNLSGSDNRASFGDSRNNFLSLTSGVNIGPWRLRDNSTWQDIESRYTHQRRWQHLNTYAERAIIPWRSELTMGDGSTNGDVFDTLSFRGLQMATDDSMYPDSLHGFAPVIRGVAHSNARVNVRQNGNIIYQTTVSSGAFAITDLYPTYSGGDLEVSVTEADGSVQRFTVPYSSVPVLQREHHFRYAVTAGRYRSTSSSYSDPEFVQGTLLWGLPHSVTAYGGLQYAQRYQAIALGAGMNLGHWGAFSADLTQANSTLADDSRHSGQSLRFLYSRVFSLTGTSVQIAGYRYSTRGFHTLDETALRGMKGWLYENQETDAAGRPVARPYSDFYDLGSSKRERVQLNLSQHLGSLGALSLTGSRQTYWNSSQASDSLQAAFSSSIGRVNYSLSWAYSKASTQPRADKTLFLSLSMPLDALWSTEERAHPIWASVSSSRDSSGNMTVQTGLNGTALEDGNLSWDIAQGHSRADGNSLSAAASYQGSKGSGSLGWNQSRNYRQLTWGASGGMLLHSGGVTFGQLTGDTAILVAAPGAANVPVDGVSGARTDGRGYTLLPYASLYRENRVALDVSRLDAHTEIENTVVHVVPTRGAVVRAMFKARQGARVMMTLTHNGKPLPFGATVTVKDNASIVGDDGEVYLSGLAMRGTLNASWGADSDQQCKVNFQLPQAALSAALYQMKAECR